MINKRQKQPNNNILFCDNLTRTWPDESNMDARDYMLTHWTWLGLLNRPDYITELQLFKETGQIQICAL